MHYPILTDLNFACVHGNRSAWINDNDARLLNRLRAKFGFLLVHRRATQVWYPVVKEVVGLRLERVRADCNDGVGKFSVFVAIVKFANAHVAGGVDFRVVSRTIVDANILDLHSPEVEFSSAPSIFVAAASASVVKRGNEKRVLAFF